MKVLSMPRTSTLHRTTTRRLHPASRSTLASALSATAELCGHAISDAAANLLAHDLADFHEPAVMEALGRCRLEYRGMLNIGEILARIDDGRPTAAEAWEMMPHSEADSVVWTREMAQAWGQAAPLLQEGDSMTARQLFQENYTQAVLLARCKREPVSWMPSLGTDPVQREQVLREAVQKERLPVSYVEQLLPYRSLSPQARQLLTQLHIKNVR